MARGDSFDPDNRAAHSERWHAFGRTYGADGSVMHVKHFDKQSVQFKNELDWLQKQEDETLRCPDQKRVFRAPIVLDTNNFSDLSTIEMELVTGRELPANRYKSYVELGRISAALHGQQERRLATVRQGTFGSQDYRVFLQDYTNERLGALANNGYDLGIKSGLAITDRLRNLSVERFTPVHRDMRTRHVIIPEEGYEFSINGTEYPTVPILLDWEYSNISDPLQDVAKAIYDSTNNGLNPDKALVSIEEGYMQINPDTDLFGRADDLAAYRCMVALQKAESRLRLQDPSAQSTVDGINGDIAFVMHSLGNAA